MKFGWIKYSVLILILIFTVCVASINFSIKDKFENRMRHAKAIKDLMNSFYLEQGMYPNRLDDPIEAFTMPLLLKPFGDNLNYTSDGKSYEICEKSPQKINIFRKGRIIIKGSPKVSNIEIISK